MYFISHEVKKNVLELELHSKAAWITDKIMFRGLSLCKTSLLRATHIDPGNLIRQALSFYILLTSIKLRQVKGTVHQKSKRIFVLSPAVLFIRLDC